MEDLNFHTRFYQTRNVCLTKINSFAFISALMGEMLWNTKRKDNEECLCKIILSFVYLFDLITCHALFIPEYLFMYFLNE